MSRYLKQSTAAQVRTIGPFVDDTDFKTAETALTINASDVRLKKNGADDVAKNSGGATHDVNGCYHLTFDATDTDTVGELFYTVKVAGALQVFGSFTVLEEAVYDALFAASAPGYVANAPVNVAQFGGSNGTFSGGRPEVNTSHAAGTAWNSGAISASTLASDTIAAAKIATGAITSAKFAAGAIDAAAIATGAIDADALAADAGTEIGAAVLSALGTGTWATAIPWNASWDAEVQSEVQDAIEVNKLDHLVAVADADDVVDNSIIAKLSSKGATADWSTFVNTTDSLEALRDRGDAAWVTATGFALASVCTEARLAELDAANLPTDVANVKIDTAAILLDTGTDGVVVAAASKTGYALSATGANLVLVAGVTLPEAIRRIGTITSGKVSGAGTGSETFTDWADSVNTIVITVDASGNRSAITYN